MSYCGNRSPKYGTLSKAWMQRAKITSSIVVKKRLHARSSLFSGPQIVYYQHTLHQYAYCSTEEILAGHFDNMPLAKRLLSQNPDLTLCSVIQSSILNTIVGHLFSKL